MYVSSPTKGKTKKKKKEKRKHRKRRKEKEIKSWGKKGKENRINGRGSFHQLFHRNSFPKVHRSLVKLTNNLAILGSIARSILFRGSRTVFWINIPYEHQSVVKDAEEFSSWKILPRLPEKIVLLDGWKQCFSRGLCNVNATYRIYVRLNDEVAENSSELHSRTKKQRCFHKGVGGSRNLLYRSQSIPPQSPSHRNC